ncbi:DGQHR domain-containing protein [Paenibacillus sp. LHD-38]|uniref:DGQHR domain-containing protein n=1 Tax=Paenibacillus sp. LHD-38 TaxID=3072143 RepID=UPI00280EA1DB|nr:DGQHR domain-containing protein [Paenibacillus sp. LHD-38]MDQ8738248.1 DGQHR domain-containing protein [Paenibacillus sp. LHD-38]
MDKLVNQIVIENVLTGKLRGKMVYQSAVSVHIGRQLMYIKPFDLPSGKGYQRPVNIKRSNDFAQYLSLGDEALFTPILLNAASNWEFAPYDRQRPNFGRLLCKGKASLMDGQHRMKGLDQYLSETNTDLSVPFLAFHYLDEDEEIKLFDTINTKAKGIGSSLNKYLRRDSDDLSWVATELMVRKESPFYQIGSIIGKRTKGRHVTLQNLYRTLQHLFSDPKITPFAKEDKFNIAITYYNGIRESLFEEWNDYNEYRLTHIVCLDALSMAGKSLLLKYIHETRKKVDLQNVIKRIQRLSVVDWSSSGPLRYIKGVSGSKSLATDLHSILIPDSN